MMGFAKSIRFSFILLLICSTIIALAGIRGFIRLAPSIELINKSNTQSLYYAEKMISNISTVKNIKEFEVTLKEEKNNITEPGEQDAIYKIENNYKSAFSGNIKAEEAVIDAITEFSNINREAMKKAGFEAKKMSSTGIWIIIFPTIFIWILGLIILSSLENTYIKPLSELQDVVDSYRKGNKMRRCSKIAASKDFQQLYDSVNQILDSK